MAQDGLHPPAPKARPRQQRKAFYPKKINHPSSPPAGGKWDSKGTSPFGAARAGLGVQRAKPFGAARAGLGVQRAKPFGAARAGPGVQRAEPFGAARAGPGVQRAEPFGAARAGPGVQRAEPFGAARAGPGVQRAEPFGPAQVCETARFVKKFAFPQDSCRSPLAIFCFTLYTNKVYRKLSRKK
ncbi:hypothetical protein D3Z52_19445 [Clostridiaceae bacterium]|nr:hypothetical protein [Clostridiaceae bacterium]